MKLDGIDYFLIALIVLAVGHFLPDTIQTNRNTDVSDNIYNGKALLQDYADVAYDNGIQKERIDELEQELAKQPYYEDYRDAKDISLFIGIFGFIIVVAMGIIWFIPAKILRSKIEHLSEDYIELESKYKELLEKKK